MEFKGQNILSTKQFDKESMEMLFQRAKEMEEVYASQREFGEGFSKILDGKVLATLFFEPSTRTRFSFESAFLRLGGKVISGADMIATSSIKKRESLADTGATVSRYADIIAMRHPEAGSVAKLADGSVVPVVNAGDGSNQHPTQALLDVYTMWKEFGGNLDGKVVAMVGDLKNGRVPHSQCDLLKYWTVKFVFVAPEALKMPGEIAAELRDEGLEVSETESLEDGVSGADVICATRIQEERFESEEEAAKYTGVYVIDSEVMSRVGKDVILMHPLPRVDEIAADVDEDPRARYFDQVQNGLIIRMALMSLILNG